MKKHYLILLLVCQFAYRNAFAVAEFTVDAIQIEGLQKISKDAVLRALPITVGQKINQDNSADIIRAIFKTGFFNNVMVDRTGNTVIIKVVERPTIGTFELIGIKSKEPIEKILNQANIAPGRIYDPAALAKVEQDIERHFLSKGNYNVKVQSKVSRQKRNRVGLVISVYAGDEAKIKQINITGSAAFTEKELLKQLLHAKTNWLSWFSKDNRYAKEKHQAELELLQSFYLDRGYVNFQIDSSQVSLSPDKKDVYVTINVSEGEKYYFGKLSLAGRFVVDKTELQDAIDQKIHEGMVFSRKTLLEVQKNLETCMGNHGYGNGQVRLNVETNDDGKQLNIEFFLQPGQRITVRRIEITGNRLTKDVVLRRGIDQMEGSWISNKELQEGKEFMLREGYASNVEVENKPVLGKSDQVDVLYKMEEQRTAQLSGGIAYSASEKFMYNLAADFRNFLGTGKNVNVSFDKSKAHQSYGFGYFDPTFTADGIGMGFNLHKNKMNLSRASHIFEYGLSSVGGDVNFSFPLSKYDTFIVGAGVDKSELHIHETIASTPDEAKAFVAKNGKQFHEYTVSAEWKHNSLDQYIFPTKGFMQRLVFRTTLPNSNLKYYGVDYENTWFHPLNDKYIVNLSSELGYKAGYNNSKYFPFFRHYFIGGADSLRGYEERSLGPKDSTGKPFGGNLLVLGKASLIFPTPFTENSKSVRTALFLDAGQVYDTNYKYTYTATWDELDKIHRNPTGFKYSVGVSLTWHSPLGVPIVISVSNPLNAKDTDNKRRFAFSFGTQFF